jgi:hypothetical protein
MQLCDKKSEILATCDKKEPTSVVDGKRAKDNNKTTRALCMWHTPLKEWLAFLL